MFQLRSTRRRTWPLAFVAALTLLLIGMLLSRARAQDILQRTLVTPSDGRAIQLQADDITTWADGGKQIFLLKGKVWIEQGNLNVRANQAVVWVDQANKKTSGIYALEVYGEVVALEDGKTSQASKTAFLKMGTRGEVRIKAYANKAVQQATPTDPLFVRALSAQKAAQPMPVPPPTPLAGVFMQDGKLQQIAGQSAASDSGIQLAQALVPAGPPIVTPPPVQTPAPKSLGLAPLQGPPGEGTPKAFKIRQRSGSEALEFKSYTHETCPQVPPGETAVVFNTGTIVTVTDPVTKKVLLDLESDRLCVWTKGNAQELFGKLRAPQGETTRALEFYLSGHVELRNQTKDEKEIIRADECYYDVYRNVAIAIRADLEIQQPTAIYPIHFKADELQQLNAKLFLAKQTEIYSTVLPSDPGLKIQVREAKIEEFDTIRKSIFGTTVLDRKTGKPIEYQQHVFTGESNVIRLEGVPIFYFPYLTANVERPLGPLDAVSANYNRIFGFQLLTTFDMYELLGLQRPENNRWKLFLDEMTARGPALGTDFQTAGKDMFGISNKYEGQIKAYGMYDRGLDILGGNRGQEILVTPFPPTFVPIEHPNWRGRIFGDLNVQELPAGFSVQAQVAAISDRNFLEQFFPNDFMNGPNQESFLYVKQQNNVWAWTFLAQADFESWMTKTDWLPKVDGYGLGVKPFDIFTYNVHASAGYGQLRPTTVVPFAYNPTDQRDNTGRFDIIQEVSLPFTLGAFKIVPYVNLDLTEYTENLTGESRGRVYGGGGIRASIPFSRLYPEVQSDLFNVNGIFHKIVLSADYYNAHSNTPHTDLPELDRLNDNASDQALRDIRPWQPIFNPTNAFALTTSPVFDPQIYALRRLVMSSIDTLDSIDVLQLDLRQRLQTKRGFPGQEHVIDWMTLDVKASIFPQAQRDNFGSHWGDIEYDWVWNIGDRTALVSNGWFEPIDKGPRVFNVGAYIGRPDRTSFYLGYRQIDPLQSRAIISSLTYAFSPKYALTFSSNVDIGNHIQTNSIMVSRIGTDLTVNFGFSYNSIVSTFGVQFEVVPNLLPTGRGLGSNAGGSLANR